MRKYFKTLWTEVPLVVIDTETTGTRPGIDRAVSFGLARFERGEFVGGFGALVECKIPIPPEATIVHGITDAMCAGGWPIEDWFQHPNVLMLLNGAQRAAYNATFDREFVPLHEEWPWLDILPIVRAADKFVPGRGRHKLSVSCERHGIQLTHAHSAGADARAAGELLYKVGREFFPKNFTLGKLLNWCMRAEAQQWYEYQNYWSSILGFREKAKHWYAGRTESRGLPLS